MRSTIGQYEKSIKALACFGEERGGVYAPALGAAFASMTISPRTRRFSAQRSFDFRRLVDVFGYVLTGWAGWTCRAASAAGVAHDRSRASSPRGTPIWPTAAWR